MPLPTILPRPTLIEARPGGFTLGRETVIVSTAPLSKIAEILKDDLVATGLPLPVQTRASKSAIELTLDPKLGQPEGYTLDVSSKGVRIRGADEAGVFYGVQTLRQLLPKEAFRKAKVEGVSWTLPGIHIEDAPRFRWRGAHLDVARHFMPKAFLLEYVDLLALQKLNTFHLHLTDDQGWRMEIKRYPKLTEIGAWRKRTMAGHFREHRYDEQRHGGFYTQDDLRELVAYAAARYVTVVPEIEMPGHSQAAIAAYPALGNLETPLEVGTDWGVIEHILNVEDSTIEFYKNVLDETLAIFPSPFIHIGGDEAPKTEWKASARVQARMKTLGLKDEHEMQSWFVRQMDAYLTSRGRRMIGWDEILEGGLAPGAAVMSWRGEAGGIAAAKAGHDVVMAPSGFTYLDYYQGDPKVEPLAIGGSLPLEKVYAFDPIPTSLSAAEANHILGGQGQLWTEYVSGPREVEYMVFPRLSALAEVLWSPKEGKSYPAFLGRLRPFLDRLKILDVPYRVPDEFRS